MSERHVWIDGHWSTTAGAAPAGAVAFETMRVVSGRVGLWPRHLRRARSTALQLGLTPPDRTLAAVLAELAERNGLGDACGRIGLGRGTVWAELSPLPADLRAEAASGVSMTTAEVAWSRPRFKWVARDALEAAERDAGEVVLRTADGRLLESTRSNLFTVTDTGLETAPLPGVLEGVARAFVLDELRQHTCVSLRPPRLDEVDRWREAFVTNALRGVRPLASLDGRALPTAPDGLTRTAQRALEEVLGSHA